jgi:hypothetical protein
MARFYFPFSRYSQRQSDVIHFDFSNTSDLVPNSLLLHKPSVLGSLVAMETGFAVAYPTGSLRSVFLIFFLPLFEVIKN